MAASVSAALLLGSAITLGWAARRRHTPRFASIALPAFLAFMAVDELLMLHERVGEYFGVAWQLAYTPVIMLGGIAWLSVVGVWGVRSPETKILLFGAACWVASQVIEQVTWGPSGVQVDHYRRYYLTEEMLEALGSAAFLFAGRVAGAGYTQTDNKSLKKNSQGSSEH